MNVQAVTSADANTTMGFVNQLVQIRMVVIIVNVPKDIIKTLLNSAKVCFTGFFLQDYGLMRSKPLRGIKVLTTEFLFLLDTEYVVFQFLNSKLCEILLNTFPGECLTLQNIKKYNIIFPLKQSKKSDQKVWFKSKAKV